MRTLTQTHLARLNSFIANKEVEFRVSGLSPRKERAAMRKLAKQVNKTYRKYGISFKAN